jgi:hypothetical protein
MASRNAGSAAPHRVWTRRVPVALCLLLAVPLTGCSGGDDEPRASFSDGTAAEIRDDVVADMEELSSVRMVGTATVEGQPVTIDVHMDTDGNCVGSIDLRGGTARLINTPTASYLQGDAPFWRNTSQTPAQGIAVAREVGAKWVRLGEGPGGFSSFCDLDQLVSSLREESTGVEKGEFGRVGGVGAVSLTKAGSAGGTVTVWAAAEGPHYILRLETVDGEEPGSFDLTDHDQPVEVEIPAASEVIDLDKLPTD